MKYAVIGAGWAGCSAAVELARRGHQVALFEASRTLGGRARQVSVHGLMLDNGQHILLGAYKATLGLFDTLKLRQDRVLRRLPLQMCYPEGSGGMVFAAPRLPSPLHMLVALIRATGLTRADKLALARFSSAARWMDWQLHTDCTVAELLDRFDQTDNLNRLMWHPLCIAALNTPAHRASAIVFLNVLKDSLGSRRAASDMLIARTDLTRLLPEPAARFVEAHGGTVHPGCAVQSVTRSGDQWQLVLPATHPAGPALADQRYDGLVIATPAETAGHLLTPFNLASHIPRFEYEPITTCYLKYPPGTRLSRPFMALAEDPGRHAYGQFVFDRGQLDGHAGLFAVVISGSQQAIESGHAELATRCAQQLATDLKLPELTHPEWSQGITEKRATFACTPNLQRPTHALPLPRCALAGDYTQSRYPATLETAVQSGIMAADCVAGDHESINESRF